MSLLHWQTFLDSQVLIVAHGVHSWVGRMMFFFFSFSSFHSTIQPMRVNKEVRSCLTSPFLQPKCLVFLAMRYYMIQYCEKPSTLTIALEFGGPLRLLWPKTQREVSYTQYQNFKPTTICIWEEYCLPMKSTTIQTFSKINFLIDLPNSRCLQDFFSHFFFSSSLSLHPHGLVHVKVGLFDLCLVF